MGYFKDREDVKNAQKK